MPLGAAARKGPQPGTSLSTPDGGMAHSPGACFNLSAARVNINRMLSLGAVRADPTTPPLPLHPRLIIGAVLASLTGLSWLYVYLQMAPMADMADMAPVAFAPWHTADFALNLLFWWAMMPGMMLPSAAPMILTFATINRRKRERGEVYAPTAVFTLGYILAWGVFAAAATVADWALEQAALISPATQALAPLWAAAVVAAAGLYQLTPLKTACLSHCRSPFDFVLNHWRDGRAGALRMGWAHGLYCLGCCWFLMALMFAAGIMSLLWMAVIAAFVLIEKLFPKGEWIARLGGIAMLGLAVYLVADG
jgi:predicted metal-binding membrane protein